MTPFIVWCFINMTCVFFVIFFSRHFKDLTGEEHNFLVIVHALTTVIYPVIKDQFNTQCPDAELKKIRQQIYDQQTTRDSNMLRNDENKSRKKKIYLTEKQKHKLFKPRGKYLYKCLFTHIRFRQISFKN